MNKQQLSQMLDQKVQEKLQEGYAITTYAMDLAQQQLLKRSLNPKPPGARPDNQSEQQWQLYLQQIKDGTYVPEDLEPAQAAFQERLGGPSWKREKTFKR